MKTITIRLPDVEAAMLDELKKTKKDFRDLELLISKLIVNSYGSIKNHRR